MAKRFYSSTATRTVLATDVTNSGTTMVVAATDGWPSSHPFTLIVDESTVNEELVEVTARSGTTLTVTRGVDGTAAVAHSSGATVRHGVSARDFSEKSQVYYQTGAPTNAGSGDVWVDSDATA